MVELRHKSFGSSMGTITQKPEVQLEQKECDLKSLIELGCVKDSIKLGEFTFQLRSLNATERFNLAQFMGKDAVDENKMFQLNIRVLALAIDTIDGKSLETFHPNFGKDANTLQLREEIVSSLQTATITKLLEFYNDISQRSDVQFETVQIKNS